MSNRCRKLKRDQCRQVLPIVSSWHVNLVLFCFDGGQVRQRCLISKFMSSIKCFGLLPQVHAQGACPFWLQFPLTEKASHILLTVQEPFAPNWFAWSGLALVWPTPVLASVKSCWRSLLVNLHAPAPFAQIGQGYLRRGLCVGILLHLS